MIHVRGGLLVTGRPGRLGRGGSGKIRTPTVGSVARAGDVTYPVDESGSKSCPIVVLMWLHLEGGSLMGLIVGQKIVAACLFQDRK
jgi:hypothetical protein